jgi:hypothetical protein
VQHLFASRGTRTEDSHSPRLHDVQPAARISRREEHVSGAVRPCQRSLGESAECIVTERGEKRHPLKQALDVHGSISSGEARGMRQCRRNSLAA